jgi:hypothetical protein
VKEPEDDTDRIESRAEPLGLRLVHSEKRERLLPDPKLKTLIEEMKGRMKRERVRVTIDDGPEAA